MLKARFLGGLGLKSQHLHMFHNFILFLSFKLCFALPICLDLHEQDRVVGEGGCQID